MLKPKVYDMNIRRHYHLEQDLYRLAQRLSQPNYITSSETLLRRSFQR